MTNIKNILKKIRKTYFAYDIENLDKYDVVFHKLYTYRKKL